MVSAKPSISFLNLISYKTVWDSCSLRILEKKTSIPASFPSENRSEDKEAVRPRVAPVLGLGEVLSLLDLLSSGPHRELLGWWREGS